MTRSAVLSFSALLMLAATLAAQGQNKKKGICIVEGSTFMAFGDYDPMNTIPLDLQGRVSYRCYEDNRGSTTSNARRSSPRSTFPNAKKKNVEISLSEGHAGEFNRYMRGAVDRLYYNLYLDASRQTVWGDGKGGTEIYSEQADFNNQVVTVPVYGRIFGAQDIRAGVYFDNLIVTLDF